MPCNVGECGGIPYVLLAQRVPRGLFAAPAVELPPDAAAPTPMPQRRMDSGQESDAHEGQLDRGRVLPGVQPRPRDA